MQYPSSVVLDELGNLYIADEDNHRVRKVIAATKFITTVVGTGSNGFSGDGGLAIAAQLSRPTGLALDGIANLYVSDLGNHRIRRIKNPEIYLPIILKN